MMYSASDAAGCSLGHDVTCNLWRKLTLVVMPNPAASFADEGEASAFSFLREQPHLSAQFWGSHVYVRPSAGRIHAASAAEVPDAFSFREPHNSLSALERRLANFTVRARFFSVRCALLASRDVCCHNPPAAGCRAAARKWQGEAAALIGTA